MAEKEIVKKTTKKANTKKTTKTSKKDKVVKETKAEQKQKLENIKAYKILSYIGILWLIGLIVPENEDKNLKFHVGQGIVLSIAQLVMSFTIRIFNTLIVGVIFREEVYYYTQPTGIYTISFFGSFLISVLNLGMIVITIYFMVIGIKNVLNNKQEELPIIGKYSFYK